MKDTSHQSESIGKGRQEAVQIEKGATGTYKLVPGSMERGRALAADVSPFLTAVAALLDAVRRLAGLLGVMLPKWDMSAGICGVLRKSYREIGLEVGDLAECLEGIALAVWVVEVAAPKHLAVDAVEGVSGFEVFEGFHLVVGDSTQQKTHLVDLGFNDCALLAIMAVIVHACTEGRVVLDLEGIFYPIEEGLSVVEEAVLHFGVGACRARGAGRSKEAAV
jgi:hypothetical protein